MQSAPSSNRPVAAAAQLPASARPSLMARLQARTALAIDGLPDALARLAPAHAHVVYAEPSPAREALFWQTAAAGLRNAATVLATREPEAIASALREHGLDLDVHGAIHHRANLCRLQPQPGKPPFDVFIEALQALADQCVARNGLLMVEGAEAFFSWYDGARLSRQGRRLAEWCARQRLSLLLVLTPPAIDPTLPPPELAGFHARFAGAVQLSQVQGQYTWEVAFWRDRDAVLASSALPLRFAADRHRLLASSDTFADDAAQSGLLAPDEQRVVVAREAVSHERWIPQGWELVDSNEAAVASASKAVAATVVFHYAGNREFEMLAEQIHRLRRTCGSALKIVVREDQEAMRQHYELLLLNLGANLVIARQTPFARMQAMLDNVQGQVFSRPLPTDYRTALSAVLTGSASGYVTPNAFIDTVRGAVEQGRTIRLPHVLLRLPLLPEVAHVDALRACRMNRAGDICSAGGDSIYVFFFACRLTDVDAVCQRVFRRPLDTLFAGELRCGDPSSILDALQAFEAESSQRPLPDYSSWLQRPAEPEPADSGLSSARLSAATAGIADPVDPLQRGEPAEAGAREARFPAPALAALREARQRPAAPRRAPAPQAIPVKRN
ncbi:cellulose biosynthesis protein BcsE [Cupriavidus sp. AU9028]|uniref:cellulose biosynthesis protein BcsE n=1 Tax=Cupriavidus sp. AU9028 TaxID=2871157 RepID=UPI001C987214|nr:cellulose biosynthesis protein BcsE [Cupriavidus sp. AU9028]MBY4896298.1 cellulose biosynthesis protein BcsE [Cupriavidus sp. AU9028]